MTYTEVVSIFPVFFVNLFVSKHYLSVSIFS